MTRSLMLLTLVLCLSGCKESNSAAAEIGYGKFNDRVYSNKYFNMSIEFPEKWAIQSNESQEQLMKTGGDLIAGDDKNLKATLKASEKQSVSLFTVFKHELGTPAPYNPSIIAVAENVSKFPGIKNGSDYNKNVKQLLGMGQIKVKYPNKTFTKDLSGKTFYVLPLEMQMGNVIVKQEYMTAIFKDYALGIIISYTNEAEKKELLDIVETLKISK